MTLIPGPDVTKCHPGTVTLGPDSCDITGERPFTYSWSPSLGLDDSTKRNPVCNANVSTTYILTVTDSFMNIAYDTINVTVLNSAISNFYITKSKDSLCAGDSISMIANYSGILDSVYWTVQSPGQLPTISGTGSDSLVYYTYGGAWQLSGTYFVNFYGKDTNGCYVNFSTSFEIIRNTTLSLASTNLTVCSDDSLTLSAVGNVSYSAWTRYSTLSQTQDSMAQNNVPFVPTNQPPHTGDYYITGTDSYGCLATINTPVVVIDHPIDSIISTDYNSYPICAGDSIILAGVLNLKYCDWADAKTGGPHIQEFRILAPNNDTIYNNPTSFGPSYYNKYDVNSTSFSAGSNYYLNIKGSEGNSYGQRFMVWVDFNHDGDFSDSLETILLHTQSSALLLDTLKIPPFAKNGRTRMRVAYNDYHFSDPCLYFWFFNNRGEKEDYDINIINGQNDSNFIWSPSTNLSNMYSSSTKVIGLSSPTTYALTYVGNGCSFSDSINILVCPTVTILNSLNMPPPLSICVGDSITLTASGAQTIQWSGGILNGQPFAPNQSQTYYVEITDSNGSKSNDSISVIVHSLPDSIHLVNPNGSKNSICLALGDSIQLGVIRNYCEPMVTMSSQQRITRVRIRDSITNTLLYENTSGSTPGHYNIYYDTLNLQAGNSYIAEIQRNTLNGLANNMNVRRIYIDLNQDGLFNELLGEYVGHHPSGCFINFNIPPSAINGYTVMRVVGGHPWPTGCQASRGDFEDYIVQISNGSSNNSSYSWSPVSLLTDTIGSCVQTVPLNNSQTFIVSTTNSFGCKSSDSITLSPTNTLPVVGANSTPNSPVCPGDLIILWGSGAQSYTWTGGAVDSVPFTPNSSQTYFVTGIDSNGCSGEDSIDVIIATPPTVSANSVMNTNPISICYGDSIRLWGSGAASYSWSGGVIDSILFAPAPIPTATRNFTVTGTDSNGCVDSSTIQMKIYDPKVTLVSNPSPAKICLGSSMTMNFTTANNAFQIQRIPWFTNPIVPDSSGTYMVTTSPTLINIPNYCRDTASLFVTVDTPQISINSYPTGPISVCTGDSVTLWVNGAQTYSWIGGINDSVPFVPLINNTYFVNGTDSNGCYGSDSIGIVVNNLPIINITNNSIMNSNPLVICQGDSVLLWGSGAQSYTWTGGITDSVSFIPPNNQNYIVTGTDSNGCSAQDSISVIINSLPAVMANTVSNMNPLNICQGDTALLWGSGAQSYTWTGGINDSTSFVPPNNQTYIVTGTDSNGCSGSDSIDIIVNNLPMITANKCHKQ